MNIMKGQLTRYENDLRRWGFTEDAIRTKLIQEKIRLKKLQMCPKRDHKIKTIQTQRDYTYGKYPWLPLCDVM